ncbi:MAG: hypothetical protein F4Z81_04840 [Gemmatimonadetes bacterium]|nr:hypothetical protein [Gemmatimonadota bacterium]MYB60371.1 hypothetical protein [Gemmatimonadota bacterium]
MPLYKVQDQQIVRLDETTFENQGLREFDLQQMLKSQIDAISPDTLIVSEEFGDWEDRKNRIDLLGIDKNADLVVIELKRTTDGGYMDLQALRYAAMISTLTFDKLVDTYGSYLRKNESEINPEESLLEFLGWEEPKDEFAQDVKIVLASAEFSKELCTSVMWLNNFGLDIRCVRMNPYLSQDGLFLDIQTLIPLPEAEEYQVRIREKTMKEREARKRSRDTVRFEVTTEGNQQPNLSSRKMIHHITRYVISKGKPIEEVVSSIEKVKPNPFHVIERSVSSVEFRRELRNITKDRPRRFFIDKGELFEVDGKTYALTNQWTTEGAINAAESLTSRYPDLEIQIIQSDSPT